MRPNSGGWTRPLTRRLIGLSMLNGIGISRLNHLTAIQFAMPQTILDGPLGHTATTTYSFRLNVSYAPRRDYLRDVEQLPSFLLITGQEDEAFKADAFETALSQASQRGTYHLIHDVGHLDIVNAPETAELIIRQLSNE